MTLKKKMVLGGAGGLVVLCLILLLVRGCGSSPRKPPTPPPTVTSAALPPAPTPPPVAPAKLSPTPKLKSVTATPAPKAPKQDAEQIAKVFREAVQQAILRQPSEVRVTGLPSEITIRVIQEGMGAQPPATVLQPKPERLSDRELERRFKERLRQRQQEL